jgi:hypothetical protein
VKQLVKKVSAKKALDVVLVRASTMISAIKLICAAQAQDRRSYGIFPSEETFIMLSKALVRAVGWVWWNERG